MKFKLILLSVFVVFINCKNHDPEIDKQSNLTLKESFKNEFLIGMAINEEISSGQDSISQNIILKQFNAITPENVMKAERINPKPGVYNFKPADDL